MKRDEHDAPRGIPDMRFINRKLPIADVAAALDLRLDGARKIHCWHPERHQHGDRTASVGIRAANNTVKCFGCDSKPMGPIDMVMDVLSLPAAHERDVIRERSVAGTNRVAEGGAWLGGIVPFAYKKVGEKRDARLVVSEEQIPGLAMSEADIIRDVFRMAAVEHKSCRVISTWLNDLRVPCAYVRDDRLTSRGKRKQRTSGRWSPGRIRGLIRNKTYMGVHEFGKRAAKERPVISRTVPAIVSEEVWKKAQQTLRSNLLFAARSARNQYLLRGLIKCGLCGLTYVGVAANRPNGKRESYYRCNGAHSPSIYAEGRRCQSKGVRGDRLEQQVWSDVEAFLRNPQPVLEQLHARLESDAQDSDKIKAQVTRLENLLTQKAGERSRVVALYRRGRLSDADLDVQMDEIGKDEAALEEQATELRARIAGADSIGATISSAQALLAQLRKRLDQPISWEMKRRLIEILVAGVRVETVEEDGVKRADITVTYRFSQPDQATPLVLPQSYSGSVIRIPTRPQTVGDHIRRRRLGLKMLQRDVATQIGVTESSVFNWEANTATPELRCMPAIIRFLGYNPLPEGKTWGERLVRGRTTLGLSQKAAAGRIGVDPSTLARWERGEGEPVGAAVGRVRGFLGDGEVGGERLAG